MQMTSMSLGCCTSFCRCCWICCIALVSHSSSVHVYQLLSANTLIVTLVAMQNGHVLAVLVAATSIVVLLTCQSINWHATVALPTTLTEAFSSSSSSSSKQRNVVTWLAPIRSRSGYSYEAWAIISALGGTSSTTRYHLQIGHHGDAAVLAHDPATMLSTLEIHRDQYHIIVCHSYVACAVTSTGILLHEHDATRQSLHAERY
jgi:hypothetical protein